MKPLTHGTLVAALILFVTAVSGARDGGAPLFAQETAQCNTNNTGAQCGVKRTCVAWRLSSGEISIKEVTGGAGVTCASEVETYLYKYVQPAFCMQCHTPLPVGGGSGGTGSGGSAGGSGGSGSSGGGSGGGSGSGCGNPDLWTDDGRNCDQRTQTEIA